MTDELGWEGLAPPNTTHQAERKLILHRAASISKIQRNPLGEPNERQTEIPVRNRHGG